MVDLLADTPLSRLLPIRFGTVALTEATPAFITSISPHKGAEKPCGDALNAAHGLNLPASGRSAGKSALRVIWTGRAQVFLVGNKPASKTLSKWASLSDQSDGWAVMVLAGRDAADVLARLCPVDFRAAIFKRGHTARTELAHMATIITRVPKGFEIMVMRSFARTAVHDLSTAMTNVAAQVDLE